MRPPDDFGVALVFRDMRPTPIRQAAASTLCPHGMEALTPRETELLIVLASGATYAECAAALGIGIGTVQGYVKSVYGKLDVSSKAEAAVAAMRLGLIS